MNEKTPTEEELKKQRQQELFRGNNWSLPPEIWLGEEIASEVEKRLLALGWNEDQIGLFPLVVHEAFINAVIYGTFDIKVEGPDKKDAREKLAHEIEVSGVFKNRFVTVELDLTSENATISVTDQGRGFLADAVPDPTNHGRLLEPTGRGIDLMKRVCDWVEFNGKSVILHKKQTKL